MEVRNKFQITLLNQKIVYIKFKDNGLHKNILRQCFYSKDCRYIIHIFTSDVLKNTEGLYSRISPFGEYFLETDEAILTSKFSLNLYKSLLHEGFSQAFQIRRKYTAFLPSVISYVTDKNCSLNNFPTLLCLYIGFQISVGTMYLRTIKSFFHILLIT